MTSVSRDAAADDELAFVADRLARAPRPEDVFGPLGATRPDQLTRLRHQYRQLALAVHPDRHGSLPAAHQAFVLLQRLYTTALELVQQGRYEHLDASSRTAGAVVISTRRREYTLGLKLAEGDLADLYTCLIFQAGQTSAGILKIARDGGDNDLLENEAMVLRHLLADMPDLAGKPVPPYVPRLLESFQYQEPGGLERQINAFPLAATERGPLPAAEMFSLEEIRREYRDGVDPKQMAWMWRRLLIALGHAHDRSVVHGAVLPSHILIHPEEHGLLLIDWCYSVHQPGLTGAAIPAIVAQYERWYPASVLAKAVPTPAVDLETAVRCMVYLLGGDPLRGALPARVPEPLQAYFQGALATVGQHTAWQLYQRFSDLLGDLWGKRTFIPFSMPARPDGGPAR